MKENSFLGKGIFPKKTEKEQIWSGHALGCSYLKLVTL